MAFSEFIKIMVKKKSHFSCCLCHALYVEVHHIIPETEGGSNIEDNAAPLCPSCHEAYGANPEKRKFIREARDFWYELCSKKFMVKTEIEPKIDELHKMLQELRECLSRSSSKEMISSDDIKNRQPSDGIWKLIIEVYTCTKRIYILAESHDINFKVFLQPILEQRYALDHIIRTKAADIGLYTPQNDEYGSENLQKALSHLYRAFFDAADWLSISLREQIIDILKPFPIEIINKVLPEYYLQFRPKIDEISKSIARVRDEHQIPETNLTAIKKIIDTYDNAAMEFMDIYEKIIAAVPTLAKAKTSKKWK